MLSVTPLPTLFLSTCLLFPPETCCLSDVSICWQSVDTSVQGGLLVLPNPVFQFRKDLSSASSVGAPCGHGVNSPISQFELLITAQPQRGSGRGCRRNLCLDNRLTQGLWMWCESTHRVSLSTGGLAPKMGGNDSNEELQDGEDGQHGKIAPAHILRTQTHSQGKQSV